MTGAWVASRARGDRCTDGRQAGLTVGCGRCMGFACRPWTIEVLRNALPDLTERFELVTLSQLVEGQQGQPSAAAGATGGGGARPRLRKARKD